MPLETTYTRARADLARLCEQVTGNRETVIIRRRGREDVALISAAELSSVSETAHLLRSPRNRQRLLKALGRVSKREGRAQSVDALRREVGL